MDCGNRAGQGCRRVLPQMHWGFAAVSLAPAECCCGHFLACLSDSCSIFLPSHSDCVDPFWRASRGSRSAGRRGKIRRALLNPILHGGSGIFLHLPTQRRPPTRQRPPTQSRLPTQRRPPTRRRSPTQQGRTVSRSIVRRIPACLKTDAQIFIPPQPFDVRVPAAAN